VNTVIQSHFHKGEAFLDQMNYHKCGHINILLREQDGPLSTTVNQNSN
jgi:hypothetical protein